MVKKKRLGVLLVCLVATHVSANEPVSIEPVNIEPVSNEPISKEQISAENPNSNYHELYAFGQLGRLSVDVSGSQAKTGSSAIGLGYTYNKHLSAEIGYSNYGDVRVNGVLVDAQSATAGAVGRYPLSNGWTLIGKLGLEYLEVNTENKTTITVGNTEFSPGVFAREAKLVPFYGVGAHYQVTENITLTAEYTMRRFSGRNTVTIKPDLDVLSLGIIVPLKAFGW